MDNAKLKLLCRMEREPDLQKLIDLSFELVGNPIFYQDVELSIPFYTKCVEVPSDFWRKNVVQGILSTERITQNMAKEEEEYFRAGKLDCMVLPPNPTHNNGRCNLAFPLRSGNTSHGVLILSAIFREYTEEDRMLFALFGEIFHTKLRRVVSLGVTGKSLTDQIFRRLLEGDAVSPALLAERLKDIRWSPRRWKHVLLIGYHGTEEGRLDSLEEVVDFLLRNPENKLLHYNNCLVYIMTTESEELPAEMVGAEFTGLMRKYDLTCGISRPFVDLMELRFYYEQAQQAEQCMLLFPKEPILRFEPMLPYIICSVWNNQRPLKDLIDPKMLALRDKDRENNSQLLQTLDMYLQCGLDVSAAAEKLFIHKNTARYRIQLCEAELGGSMRDGELRFRTQLSLRALFYLHQIGQEYLLDKDVGSGNKSIDETQQN